MVLHKQIIQDCKNQVIKNEKISDSNAKILFNTDEKFLKNLSDAANEITRFFQGKKIDVEPVSYTHLTLPTKA